MKRKITKKSLERVFGSKVVRRRGDKWRGKQKCPVAGVSPNDKLSHSARRNDQEHE